MSNLIPEKRMDRNGRLVTRHVRHAEQPSPASLPVPKGARRKTAFKPVAKQTVRWQIELKRTHFQADKELQGNLPNSFHSFTPEVSDIEAYGLLSVLEPRNAVPLMDSGIRTSAEARAFLKKHNLDRLIVDRSAHAEEALRRRIPAQAYLKLCESETIQNVPLPELLDAAEVYAMGFSVELYQDVLRGYALLSDIKAIGAPTIRKAPNDVREFIWDLKEGTSTFNHEQIREIVRKTSKERIGLFEAADLADVIGAEEVVNRYSILASYYMMSFVNRVMEQASDDAKATVTKSDLIIHYDGMVKVRDEIDDKDSPHWEKLNYADSIEMVKRSIGPREGWEGIRNGMSVQQILAVRDHGISQSVSSGWL